MYCTLHTTLHYCSTLHWHWAILTFSTVLHTIMQDSKLCTALHCTALHCTVLLYTTFHCTVNSIGKTTVQWRKECGPYFIWRRHRPSSGLHCAALHCTARHCTALHCSVIQYTDDVQCGVVLYNACHVTLESCTVVEILGLNSWGPKGGSPTRYLSDLWWMRYNFSSEQIIHILVDLVLRLIRVRTNPIGLRFESYSGQINT